MTVHEKPCVEKPKGQFGHGRPHAVPAPCTKCGKVTTGLRKGLCQSCYSLELYHRRQGQKTKKPEPTLPGLTELENYVWKHSTTSTIGEICQRMGCMPKDVRTALDAGILALHGMKRKEG